MPTDPISRMESAAEKAQGGGREGAAREDGVHELLGALSQAVAADLAKRSPHLRKMERERK